MASGLIVLVVLLIMEALLEVTLPRRDPPLLAKTFQSSSSLHQKLLAKCQQRRGEGLADNSGGGVQKKPAKQSPDQILPVWNFHRERYESVLCVTSFTHP